LKWEIIAEAGTIIALLINAKLLVMAGVLYAEEKKESGDALRLENACELALVHGVAVYFVPMAKHVT